MSGSFEKNPFFSEVKMHACSFTKLGCIGAYEGEDGCLFRSLEIPAQLQSLLPCGIWSRMWIPLILRIKLLGDGQGMILILPSLYTLHNAREHTTLLIATQFGMLMRKGNIIFLHGCWYKADKMASEELGMQPYISSLWSRTWNINTSLPAMLFCKGRLDVGEQLDRRNDQGAEYWGCVCWRMVVEIASNFHNEATKVCRCITHVYSMEHPEGMESRVFEEKAWGRSRSSSWSKKKPSCDNGHVVI